MVVNCKVYSTLIWWCASSRKYYILKPGKSKSHLTHQHSQIKMDTASLPSISWQTFTEIWLVFTCMNKTSLCWHKVICCQNLVLISVRKMLYLGIARINNKLGSQGQEPVCQTEDIGHSTQRKDVCILSVTIHLVSTHSWALLR